MSKFVLLFILILTLVAVSTAKWTITLPQTADAGQTIQIDFKNDAAVHVADEPIEVNFAFTPDLLTDEFLVGMAGGACSISPTNTLIPYSLESNSVSFTLVSNLAANSQISCTFRIHYAISSATEYFVSIGDEGQPGYSKSTLTLNNFTLTAIASSSPTTKTYVEVSFELTGLPKSTVIGPISFAYRANKIDYNVNDSVFAAINHKDGRVVFNNIRLVFTNDSKFYLMTNEATTGKETIVVQFPIDNRSADTTNFSATIDIAKYFKQDGSASLTAETNVTLPVDNPFRSYISRSQRTDDTWVNFVYEIAYSPVDAVEISFVIDGYTPEVIFGPNSRLSYQLGNSGSGNFPLNTSEKKFTYLLPNVVKNKPISIHGSFQVDDNDLVFGKVKFSINGAPQFDSSAEMGIYINSIKYELQSSTDEQLVFQVTSKLSPSFASWTEPVPFSAVNLPVSYTLLVDSKDVRGEIRKQGEFLPTCTLDDSKKNVSVKCGNATSQGVHSSLTFLTIEGEFANGADIIVVTCVQALNKGKKTSKNISISGNPVTAAWSTVTPVTFDQTIHVFTESPITNSVDFNTLVTQVVAELVKVDQFSELNVANFPYVWLPTMPQVGSGQGIARKFQFNTDATSWTATAAHYEFGINRKDSQTGPIYQVITLPTFTIIIDPDPASVLTNSHVWLDANDETVYDTTQMVQQANTCWSSQQCAADYFCVDSTCTPWSLLTLKQQSIIYSFPSDGSQDDDENDENDENDSHIAVSVIAMSIAFVSCFF